LDLLFSGRRRPFGYAAADTFYYLVVARNVARHGSFSLDGRHATNGFHPLWQLLTSALDFATEHLGLEQFTLYVAIFASLALIAGGIALLATALAQEGRLTPLFALVPVGLYGLLVAPFWLLRWDTLADGMEGPPPVYGTLWSYANGMESGAVLFSFGLGAFLQRAWFKAPSVGSAARYGIALAALTLARLDHVFISLALVAALLHAAYVGRRPWREPLAALAAFGLPVGLDVFINMHWFGSAMPVSGALKTSFPHITQVHIQSWLDMLAHPRQFNLWILQREASLLVPALFALVYLALTLRVMLRGPLPVVRYRETTRDYDRFLAPTAFGILLLASYNVLFLTDGPGSWYVPVSTLFVSLVPIALVDRGALKFPDVGAHVLLAGVVLVSVVFFLKLERQLRYHRSYADFCLHEAPLVKQHFHGRPPRFIEMDDGIVSYSLDSPAMSAGLSLDPEGVDAMKANHLFALGYRRGFKCISSLVYMSATRFLTDKSPTAALAYVRERFDNQDLSKFEFKLAYVTPSGSLALVCGQKK
jgi:hypothetical protein